MDELAELLKQIANRTSGQTELSDVGWEEQCMKEQNVPGCLNVAPFAICKLGVSSLLLLFGVDVTSVAS